MVRRRCCKNDDLKEAQVRICELVRRAGSHQPDTIVSAIDTGRSQELYNAGVGGTLDPRLEQHLSRRKQHCPW